MATNVNIVTLKWGTRYTSEDVNRVFTGTRRYGLSEHPFHCFTDSPDGLHKDIVAHPLPEIDLPEKYRWTFWRKLCLFQKDFPITGGCLYFDVDVAIVGPLENLFAHWEGEPRFVKNWLGKKTLEMPRYDGINSSVVLFTGGKCEEVIHTFRRDENHVLETYPGDQGFVYDCLAKRCDFFEPELCVSFKRHCLAKFPLNLLLTPKPPPGASVVIFHGRPDPGEARDGFRGKKLKINCRPTPWI